MIMQKTCGGGSELGVCGEREELRKNIKEGKNQNWTGKFKNSKILRQIKNARKISIIYDSS